MRTPVTIYFTVFMLTWLAFSCTEDKPEKSVVLQKLIESLEKNAGNCACLPYINEYVWENKTVYVLAFKGPLCNWIPSYYDENGMEFNMAEGYSYAEFLEDSTLVENVWTCQE